MLAIDRQCRVETTHEQTKLEEEDEEVEEEWYLFTPLIFHQTHILQTNENQTLRQLNGSEQI